VAYYSYENNVLLNKLEYLNFLGRQKMVTVPIRWKSGEGDKHPETELAYITKPEERKLN
jgi:hypothetical protein